VTSCANFPRLLNRISHVNCFLGISESLRSGPKQSSLIRTAQKSQNIVTTRQRVAEHSAPKFIQRPDGFCSVHLQYLGLGLGRSDQRSKEQSPRLITTIKRLDCAPSSPLLAALYRKSRVRSCCLLLTESIKVCVLLQTFILSHRTKRVPALYIPASHLLCCDFLRVSAVRLLRNLWLCRSCASGVHREQIAFVYRGLACIRFLPMLSPGQRVLLPVTAGPLDSDLPLPDTQHRRRAQMRHRDSLPRDLRPVDAHRVLRQFARSFTAG